MPVTEIAGAPRSMFEIEFLAGLRACDVCGDHQSVAWRTGGHGEAWIVRGVCPRCSTERAYAFRSTIDLVAVKVGDLALGGPEPSQILEPFDFVREVDRLAPLIVLEPEMLDGAVWRANATALARLRTSLVELAKFVANGEIPRAAHRSSFGLLDREMRTERYRGAWIVREQQYWQRVASRIALDAPRVFAAERQAPHKQPRGTLELGALADHRAWIETGRGRRLDVVTGEASGRTLRSAQLAESRLEAVALVGADLHGSSFDRADLIELELAKAWLENATFRQARMSHCDLEGAIGVEADFADMHAIGCDFSSAKLDASVWLRARLERCGFAQADLADASLNLARFTACDLRGVRFAGAALAGALFERCDFRGASFGGADLRGATFVECAFGAARGEPLATAGWIVTAADFSERADGSDLGDATDLYEELTAS